MNNYLPFMFSLDGVVRDFVKNLNFELEKRGKVNYDYAEWYLHEIEDEDCDEITSSNLFWKNLKPFDDAWYQINYFFGRNVPIYILCDSYDVEREMKWLDSWRIPYNDVISFRGDIDSFIRSHYPSIIVDDHPDRVEYYRDMHVSGFLKRSWYNRDRRDKLPNLGDLFEIKAFDD